MIHLEILHQSPRLGIGILRLYLNPTTDTPQAFELRKSFDYSCVFMWRPHYRQGTIKALAGNPTTRVPLSPTTIQDLGAFLHAHTEVTKVTWERASHKKVTLFKTPERWQIFNPVNSA